MFSEISPAALMRLIGTPAAPQILDVITDDDFALDPTLIPSAIQVPHRRAAEWAQSQPGPFVIVCQKGKKLSHGVAALIRQNGQQAEVLSGGNVAWRAAGLPRLAAEALKYIDKPWVTKQRPKIDRIACPWLIRRFIAPNAKVLFVPAGEVQGVAEKFDATPFDGTEAPFCHQGVQCTFDAFLDLFDLRTPALDRLAGVIRAADTGALEHAPQAAGLLAVSVGLSKTFKDDTAQLEAGLTLYDALYRWARDGAEETHTHSLEEAV